MKTITRIDELEKCILFYNPFVGPSQDNKKRIETLLKTNDFDPQHIEELILSYAGGNKLIENQLKDSNRRSSGHVWDTAIYSNISDIFDFYVKDSNKSCKYFVLFIEKIINQLRNYNIVSKFIYQDLCQFQNKLLYDLYSSLIKYVKMTNFQRLDLTKKRSRHNDDFSILL